MGVPEEVATGRVDSQEGFGLGLGIKALLRSVNQPSFIWRTQEDGKLTA